VVQKHGLLPLVLNAFFDYVASCQDGVMVVMMKIMVIIVVIIIIIIIIMFNGYIALSEYNFLISI